MARDGLVPFCNIYSAFSQRAYDNIIHDVAISRLHVIFCLDRAGLVGEDGPTHHGAFDLAALRPIPNLTISSPLNEHELRRLMYTAQQDDMGPFVIRYPRGCGVLKDWKCPLTEVEVGHGQLLKEGSDIVVLSLGPIGCIAAEAIREAEEEAKRQCKNLNIAHYDMRFLKPIDQDILHTVGKNFSRIITLEDGVVSGGLGSAVLEFMSENDYTPHVTRLGLPDEFVEHGTPAQLYHIVGIDKEGIKKTLLS